MSDEVQFLRQLQSAQESSSGIFSDALASMLSGVEERPLATLYLNLNSPIVRRLCTTRDAGLLESMVQVLYVQALLAGGHPLRRAQDYKSGPAGLTGACGGNLIAGKGRYIV